MITFLLMEVKALPPKLNSIGYIGYCLEEEYNGKGIMTKSVQELVKIGHSYYSFNRIDIR